jgi:hypothetical protein
LYFVTTILPASTPDQTNKFGISGSFQSSQLGIALPIRIGESFTISPSFALSSIDQVGTDIQIGLQPRWYFEAGETQPFLAFRGGLLFNSPSTGSSIVDGLIGISFGGEHYISPKFSIGIEAGFSLGIGSEKSMRFGPSGLMLSTGTSLFATIYF